MHFYIKLQQNYKLSLVLNFLMEFSHGGVLIKELLSFSV